MSTKTMKSINNKKKIKCLECIFLRVKNKQVSANLKRPKLGFWGRIHEYSIYYIYLFNAMLASQAIFMANFFFK